MPPIEAFRLVISKAVTAQNTGALRNGEMSFMNISHGISAQMWWIKTSASSYPR